MPPKGHALLSASSAKRWLNCPPSARLGEKYEEKTSDYALEGTDAHELCEYRLKTTLGIPAIDPTDNLTWFNEEMNECAEGYASFILELIEEAKHTCKDPLVLIEQRLDFSEYVKSGFGTGDCVIITDGTLHVIDYKHGKGVLVDAVNNPQMMLYALGALNIFDGLYDIDTVSMTIYQPRISNISTYTMAKSDLYDWAENTLKPTAQLAYNGEGEFSCGDWCMFCKAKHECRARAEHNLSLARFEFGMPPTLSDSDVEHILSQLDDLVSWANDIKEYAFQEALRGKKWQGWKLVEGRSNRKFADENAVAEAVLSAGFEPYERKLMGITEMQKQLGKARFDELLGGLIVKPQGKPTLVPITDKRQEINRITDDFKEN